MHVGIHGKCERWGDRWAVECERVDEKELLRRLSDAGLAPKVVARSRFGSPEGYPVIAFDFEAESKDGVRELMDILGFTVGLA